jgi:hypothetical protein
MLLPLLLVLLRKWRLILAVCVLKGQRLLTVRCLSTIALLMTAFETSFVWHLLLGSTMLGRVLLILCSLWNVLIRRVYR